MSLFIASINSGSNGNCYYIGNEREAVLIDAGLSCRETEKRMARMGLSFRKVRAVFISHEHTDHIRGMEGIAHKHHIPVYISGATHSNSRFRLNETQFIPLTANSPIQIGGLTVNAFLKQHDAAEPHSFTICGNGVTVGVLTDIGTACERVIRNFSQCHAAFLEANYDEVMLEEGSYPRYLKKRIASDIGHLSNHQALDLFTTHKSPFMSHLFLSHLSEANNDPQLVHDLFKEHAGGTHIAIASRYEESSVYCIHGFPASQQSGNGRAKATASIQMKLF
jgi:phosphoribosyl 1,2-cyclic phosphodiesterase